MGNRQTKKSFDRSDPNSNKNSRSDNKKNTNNDVNINQKKSSNDKTRQRNLEIAQTLHNINTNEASTSKSSESPLEIIKNLEENLKNIANEKREEKELNQIIDISQKDRGDLEWKLNAIKLEKLEEFEGIINEDFSDLEDTHLEDKRFKNLNMYLSRLIKIKRTEIDKADDNEKQRALALYNAFEKYLYDVDIDEDMYITRGLKKYIEALNDTKGKHDLKHESNEQQTMLREADPAFNLETFHTAYTKAQSLTWYWKQLSQEVKEQKLYPMIPTNWQEIQDQLSSINWQEIQNQCDQALKARNDFETERYNRIQQGKETPSSEEQVKFGSFTNAVKKLPPISTMSDSLKELENLKQKVEITRGSMYWRFNSQHLNAFKHQLQVAGVKEKLKQTSLGNEELKKRMEIHSETLEKNYQSIEKAANGLRYLYGIGGAKEEYLEDFLSKVKEFTETSQAFQQSMEEALQKQGDSAKVQQEQSQRTSKDGRKSDTSKVSQKEWRQVKIFQLYQERQVIIQRYETTIDEKWKTLTESIEPSERQDDNPDQSIIKCMKSFHAFRKALDKCQKTIKEAPLYLKPYQDKLSHLIEKAEKIQAILQGLLQNKNRSDSMNFIKEVWPLLKIPLQKAWEPLREIHLQQGEILHGFLEYASIPLPDQDSHRSSQALEKGKSSKRDTVSTTSSIDIGKLPEISNMNEASPYLDQIRQSVLDRAHNVLEEVLFTSSSEIDEEYPLKEVPFTPSSEIDEKYLLTIKEAFKKFEDEFSEERHKTDNTLRELDEDEKQKKQDLSNINDTMNTSINILDGWGALSTQKAQAWEIESRLTTELPQERLQTLKTYRNTLGKAGTELIKAIISIRGDFEVKMK